MKMNIFERRAKADSIVPECAGMDTSAIFPLLAPPVPWAKIVNGQRS